MTQISNTIRYGAFGFKVSDITIRPEGATGLYIVDVKARFYGRRSRADIEQQYLAKYTFGGYRSIEILSEKFAVVNGVDDEESRKEFFDALSASAECIGGHIMRECF